MRGSAVALAVLAVAVSAAPAQGVRIDRFIKVHGMISGSCTTAATACNYRYVLNGSGSTSGNRVTVLPGTYDVTDEPILLQHPLNIRGSGTERPLFEISSASGNTTTITIVPDAAGSSLSHLAIHNAGTRAIGANGKATFDDLDVAAKQACLDATANGTTVTDSLFAQTGAAMHSPCVALGGADGRISGSTINASVSGLSIAGEATDMAITSDGIGAVVSGTLDRSIVRAANGDAVQLAGAGNVKDSVALATGGGDAVSVGEGAGAAVRNVSAVSSHGRGMRAVAGDDDNHLAGGSVDARNVIARGGAGDVDAQAPGCSVSECPSITLTSSNFVTSAGFVTDGGGNQSGDPLFKDAPAADFHLLAGSPAIDAGTDDGTLGPNDPDGNARTLGAAPDIGAYETSPAGGGGGGGGPGAKDTFPPVLTALKVAKGKIGFKLSEPAAVTFTVQRRAAGRRSHGKCVKPSRKLRHAKRCARFRRVGALKANGVQGKNSVKFGGKIGKRKLARGRYRLLATARDAAGNKTPRPAKTGFRIR